MLEPAQAYEASTAVRELRVALSNFFLYATGNNMTLLSIQRFLGALEALFQKLPSVTLGESEGRLVVEATPLDERTTGSINMIKDLFLTHKLHSLTFIKGVDAEELKNLFSLLRPKGLPTGLSLSQALVQKSLEHIRANEKVFVTLSEGETVVQGDAVPKGEQNLQEALEALQYFLQIFARVRPESNKKEVAQKLMDNMGSWLQTEGLGSSSGKKAGPEAAQAWLEVLGTVMALKNGLAALKTPGEVKDSQAGMDELLKKLVLLGQEQGVDLKEGAVPAGVTVPPMEGPAPAPPKVTESDPRIVAIGRGHFEAFWEPGLEDKVDEEMIFLQEPEQVEIFANLWDDLWEKIFSADEKTQALCLRHMNRLRWDRLPRALQVEGLKHLGKFLSETKRPSVYPIGLTLAQDWVPLEMGGSDWSGLLEIVRVLKQLADKRPPAFDKQNLAAKVALETIFCEPVMEACLKRYQAGTLDAANCLQLCVALNTQVTAFLFMRMEEELVESPAWTRVVEFLNALQTAGFHVYEDWLERPEKKGQIEKFLDVFKVTPLTGEMVDYFERHWTSFSPPAQEKILTLIEIWDRKGSRPFLLRLLEKPETHAAFHTLRVLGKVGLEGDGAIITESVKRFPPHGKDREKFWIEACKALGELADNTGLEALMEWAAKFKLITLKKEERTLAVRRAAIEALGRFRSKAVKTFLEGLHKEGEKELAPVVGQALRSVEEKLGKTAEPKYES